ncbi:MAG: hypothetical protein RIQ53_316, partial [Pseudomonadota bacterium]
YALTLPALDRDDEAATAAALRAFELFLLRESGVLPELGRVTQTQQPVEPQARHGLHAEHGVTAPDGRGGAHLSGATLHALEAALDAGDLAALRQACRGALPALRTLLRGLLHYHLDTSMLRTRALMVEIQKLTEHSAPP